MTRTHITPLVLLAMAGVAAACQAPPDADPASTDAPADVSVTVAPIVRTTLHAYVEGWGRVEPEPAGDGRPAADARVTSPVPGLVTEVLAREGQRVDRGAMLFHLDSRVADVAVERAQQAVQVATQLLKRQDALGPGEATSQKAFQEAQAQLVLAQSELRTAELERQLLDVHAPIAGTVVLVHARLGDAIDPSTVLADIVDLSRLVVSAPIRSVDIEKVRRGQRMEFFAGAAPDGSNTAPRSSGTVDYVGSQVDTSSDTVVVRARVPGATAMRPGQFVNVRIVTEERKDRLAVPIDSVVRADDQNEVAVVTGETATRTPVDTGLQENGLIEVVGDGIREGVPVVVQGAYSLPATSHVTVVGR